MKNSTGLRVEKYFLLLARLLMPTGQLNRSAVLVLSVCVCVSFLPGSIRAEDDQVVAVRQALEWLATIDNADYPGSFAAMAGKFTTGVREKVWQQRISMVRKPLGLVRSRLLESTELKSGIVGAPAGDYLIVRFSTVFESEPSTTEAVTMYRQDDGSWKSAGYDVRKSD